MAKPLNKFQISTTAWDEEDFLLITSLSESQITKVIQPIVEDERENDIQYDNEQLVEALRSRYPKATITFILPSDFELISV